MISITQFCEKHSACADGREWALANCRDMQHAWDTLKPDWLLWVATRPGVLTDRDIRLFAVWCARQVQHLMTDPRSIAALDVAERHASNQATDDELAAARAAAWDAAGDAAGDAAWDAAWDAARTAQAAWLRANTQPDFGGAQ